MFSMKYLISEGFSVRKFAWYVSACCVAGVVCGVYLFFLPETIFWRDGYPFSCPYLSTNRTLAGQTKVPPLHDDNAARRKQIKSVCERYQGSKHLHHPTPGWGMSVPSKRRGHRHCHPETCPLFVDDSHSLAFCFIAKVASTTIKRLFAPRFNVTVIENDTDSLHGSFHDQTYRFGPRTLLQSDRKNYTKAIFVRHPFERIVSTYIDKALRGRYEMRWAYESYWDKIPGVKVENRSPTFPEYVEFILAMPVGTWDEHWSPYYARCQPCLLDYTFVGKLETASTDFPTFLSLAGVETHFSLKMENSRYSVGGIVTMDSKEYFSQLTFDQVMRLYARYFYDFELFGYNFRDYLP
ncbi:carbohydrate sulfotransferase 8-like isoform X6 [Haemaphysalis longicornis]